jgi:hypothetical protein
MSTGLLVAAVLVGVLVCPAMMWWQSRRGRVASCASPFAGSSGGSDDVDELRRRHDALAAAIREAEGTSPGKRVGRGTT